MNGVEALHILHGEPLDKRLKLESAVYRDCLEIAMRELTFCAMPNTRQALRVIRERLHEAGLEVQG